MMTPPSVLRAHIQKQAFELSWPDSQQAVDIPFRALRGGCPCAACVNEMTGERTFFEKDVSEDIFPEKLDLVGNYAVKISWSDGHNTGLYTWEYLREIFDRIASGSDLTA